MKTIKITAVELTKENQLGEDVTDIVIGKNTNGNFFVQTSDGIMEYTNDEMQEIYGLDKLELGKVMKLLWNLKI